MEIILPPVIKQLVLNAERVTSNMVRLEITALTDGLLKQIKEAYSDKWVFHADRGQCHTVWIKDKPQIIVPPAKGYHVSRAEGLERCGIWPCSHTTSGLGYEDLSFFYSDVSNVHTGSRAIGRCSFVYEVDTSFTDRWFADPNRELATRDRNVFVTDLRIPAECVRAMAPNEYGAVIYV